MKKGIMVLLLLIIIGTISVGAFSLSNIGILVVATVFLVVLVIKKDTKTTKNLPVTATNVAIAQEYISDNPPADFPDDIQIPNSQNIGTFSAETENYGQQAI